MIKLQKKKKELVYYVWDTLNYTYKVGEITETNYGKEKAKFYDCIEYHLEEDRARYDTFSGFGNKFYNGYLKFYDTNGILNQEGNYLNGKMEGKWISYWDNGKIRRKENYLNNGRIGKSLFYYYNELTMEERDYDDNRPIKIYEKNESGEWIYNDEETKKRKLHELRKLHK